MRSLAVLSLASTGAFLALGLFVLLRRRSDVASRVFVISPGIAAERIFSSISDLLLLVDVEGRIQRVNPAVRVLLGYRESDLIGQPVGLVLAPGAEIPVPPEGAVAWVPRTSGRTSRLGAFEVSLRGKAGELVRVSLSRSEMWDEDGTHLGHVLVGRDLTQIESSKARIEYLNRVLRAVFSVDQLIVKATTPEALVDGACGLLVETRGYGRAWIVLCDEAQRPVHAAARGRDQRSEPAAERIRLGEAPLCCQRALSHPGIAAIEDPCADCARCPWADPCSCDRALTVRLEHDAKTYGVLGVTIPADAVPDAEEKSLLADLASNIAHALYNLEHERQRKKLDEQLRKSEEKWRSLVENAPSRIMLVDRRHVIQFANRPPDGVVSERVIGTSLYDHAAAADHDTIRSCIEQVLMTGVPARCETMGGRDGDDVCHETTVGPVTEDGQIVGAILIATDITARRQVERQLRWANQELQEAAAKLVQTEKLAAMGELAASVAHELNQPLNAIKVIGQSILRYPESYDRQAVENDLREIVALVGSMAEIIDAMRVFARRSTETERRSVDVNAVIQGVLRLVGEQIRVQDIELATRLDPHLPSISGDATRLWQVLLNLITNARDAVAARPGPDRRIEVSTRRPADGDPLADSHILIEVSDNGMGMAEHVRQAIFQPFFTTKDPGKGTGLGLSIARKIVEEHEGRIEVRSEPGRGTRFTVALPTASGQAVDARRGSTRTS